MSIVKVATKLSEGDLMMSEIIVVLHQALRGGGNNMDAKQVSKLIWDAGMVESMAAVGEVLTNTLMGGNEASEGKDSE